MRRSSRLAVPGIGRAKSYFITGGILLIPAIVTVALLSFLLQTVFQFLSPVTGFLAAVSGLQSPLLEGMIVGLIIVGVIGIGFFVETIPHGVAVAEFFHTAAESIPGIGSVYAGFREMSETIARGEESFRDVKLVEYPSAGSYTMAFVTADAPHHLEESVGQTETGMMSLFLPMGPNPIMGGFVIYVARDRVYDIEISVEQGLQAIITSGVTMSDPDGPIPQDRL